MKKLIILILITVSSTAIFAQKSKQDTKTNDTSALSSSMYTCPMHPDVTSSKPGKCPKCNSDLVLSKKQQMKMEVMKIYTCPMHPGVSSDKAGKCSICGMDLVEKPIEKKDPNMKM